MKLTGLLCFFYAAILSFNFDPRAHAKQPVTPSQDPMTYKIISDTDLTAGFHTKTKWRLVITQEPDDEEFPEFPIPGYLHLCFIHEDSARCASLAGYNILDDVKIIPSNDTLVWPLLVLTADAFTGGPGQPKGTQIWVYRPNLDRFEQTFENETAQNHNEETRIMTSGPLSDDVIIDVSTVCAPWPYRIVAYRMLKSARYVKAFDYLGKTRSEDGDPRPVIDSEMAQIERRLLHRKAGVPLQVTKKTHPRCKNYDDKRELNSIVSPRLVPMPEPSRH